MFVSGILPSKSSFPVQTINWGYWGSVGIVATEAYNKRLAAQGITFTADDSAKLLLAEKGYDPIYGARPLKRVIQRELETLLSKKIIAGEIKEGSTVRATATGGAIEVTIS